MCIFRISSSLQGGVKAPLTVIALICLFGISGIYSGLAAMAISPFGGFILLLSSIASVLVGIIFSRIAAEFVLIVFRINEHLGAIRDQGEGY